MVRKGTKSKQIRIAQIDKISKLLDKWLTDQQIMTRLGIPETTYYRYKQQIYKQDKRLLEQSRSDELSHRIMQVKKSLEYCISINKDICERSKDDKARIEASRLIVQANMGLVNLAKDTPYSEQVRIITRDVTANTDKNRDLVNEE